MSSEHWKVSASAAVTLSVPVKLNDAVVSPFRSAGADVTVVVGAVVSAGGWATTVQVAVAGLASVLPAASRARTETVWLPTARPV